MPDQLEQLDQAIISNLRCMARAGRTPSEMLRELKQGVGTGPHIATVLDYFRQAFCLTLADVKPIAALSRNPERNVEDEALLDQLLMPPILSHHTEWEDPRT